MRIAVLGAGTMGQVHAAAYAAMEDVELRAVWAPSGRRADPLAARLGTAATADLPALLADPALDAVDICLPTPVHRGFVVAALEAGKHVFCETPLALSLADAEAMRAAAGRSGRHLQVALLSRSLGPCRHIRQALVRGDLGRPLSARAYRLGSYLLPQGQDHREHYGDPTTELMTFDLDMLGWLFGPPQVVRATAARLADGRPGHVVAALAYGSVAASVEASGVMPPSFPFSVGLRVTGTAGALDLAATFAGDGPPEERLLWYPAAGPAEAVRPAEDGDPYAAECRHFVDCVRGTADPDLLAVDRAIEALRVSVAIQRQLQDNAGPAA